MPEEFRKQTHSRSTVTVKFSTSMDAYSIAADVPRNGIIVEPTGIESITIVERTTLKLIPEWLAKRADAAQKARESRDLVSARPDPRD